MAVKRKKIMGHTGIWQGPGSFEFGRMSGIFLLIEIRPSASGGSGNPAGFFGGIEARASQTNRLFRRKAVRGLEAGRRRELEGGSLPAGLYFGGVFAGWIMAGP